MRSRVRHGQGPAVRLIPVLVIPVLVWATVGVPAASAAQVAGSAQESVAGSAQASVAGVPGLRPPVIDWQPCVENETAQCAQLAVPLDYDRSAGATIDLALARLPATDPAGRIGTLFVNPGGPGGSGVDLVLGAGEPISRAVRGRFDIVGFDPRGVAGSTPLTCFDTEEQQQAALPSWPFPVGAGQIARQQLLDRRLASACARRGGVVIDHMSTADVARDLDLLRAAVGDQRLSYLGFSYGTQLGTVYANLFPQRVRAVVLDGVVDPVAWTVGTPDRSDLPFSTRLRSDKGAQSTLEQFFLRCDRAAVDDDPATDCRFGPDARARFARLAGQLRAAPLQLPDSSTFGYADLVGSTLGALYAPAVWRDLAELLAMAAQRSPVRVLAARRDLAGQLGVDPATRRVHPRAAGVSQSIEGFAGVSCSDSRNPAQEQAWPRAADWASAHAGGYFGAIWTWASSPCQPWPGHGQDRYLGPWSARTAAPVLVVGNYYDPATRYLGAVRVASSLPGSRLLSYAGWGHTVFLFGGSDCVDAAISAYLVEGVLPAPGTVCRPEFDPFAVTLFVPADRWSGSRGGAGPAPRGPGPTSRLRPAPRPAPPGATVLPPAVDRALGGLT